MRVISEPIEVIVWFKKESQVPQPLRFKYTDVLGNSQTVVIQKILSVNEERLTGIESLIYKCQSVIGEQEKIYELRFFSKERKWQLYKI